MTSEHCIDHIHSFYIAFVVLKTLDQEGAAIIAFKILEKGVFQEEGISALLCKAGTENGMNCRYHCNLYTLVILCTVGSSEGCVGTRLLADNLSDLKAQVMLLCHY